MAFKPWRRVPGKALLWLINLFSAVALIFEGYNQGVMGFVNGSAGYIETVGIGSDGVVTDTTKQGGLVAVYYFGAMFGCFLGGWVGDRQGRKMAVTFGSILALTGGSLQAGSQNSNMTICARVICGVGIGFINSVRHPQACRTPLTFADHSSMGFGVSSSTQQRFRLRIRVLCQLCRHRHCLLAWIWPTQ